VREKSPTTSARTAITTSAKAPPRHRDGDESDACLISDKQLLVQEDDPKLSANS
jgi:hypothetical protein